MSAAQTTATLIAAFVSLAVAVLGQARFIASHLGKRIDDLAAHVGSRIDAQSEHLGARLDDLRADVSAHLERIEDRVGALERERS